MRVPARTAETGAPARSRWYRPPERRPRPDAIAPSPPIDVPGPDGAAAAHPSEATGRRLGTAILLYHLRDRPLEPSLDLEPIARDTEDFSGADLAHLCEVAAELAMEASAASGQVRPIGAPDLKRARKEVRPSIRAWLETARNYALFANEGGAYDELVDYLRRRKLA